MSSIGLILLAAGGSRRLGSPKQLLRDEGGLSLIRRAAQAAAASQCRPIVAVLGASAEDIRPELAGLPLTVAINPDWQTGMASSLQMGLNSLEAAQTFDAVVVMLCDQPAVTGALLDALIAAYQATGHSIVACEYGETVGVPALFDQVLFAPLAALTGDEGARRVIRGYRGPISRLPFPEGLLDIDIPQDISALRRANSAA